MFKIELKKTRMLVLAVLALFCGNYGYANVTDDKEVLKIPSVQTDNG